MSAALRMCSPHFPLQLGVEIRIPVQRDQHVGVARVRDQRRLQLLQSAPRYLPCFRDGTRERNALWPCADQRRFHRLFVVVRLGPPAGPIALTTSSRNSAAARSSPWSCNCSLSTRWRRLILGSTRLDHLPQFLLRPFDHAAAAKFFGHVVAVFRPADSIFRAFAAVWSASSSFPARVVRRATMYSQDRLALDAVGEPLGHGIDHRPGLFAQQPIQQLGQGFAGSFFEIDHAHHRGHGLVATIELFPECDLLPPQVRGPDRAAFAAVADRANCSSAAASVRPPLGPGGGVLVTEQICPQPIRASPRTAAKILDDRPLVARSIASRRCSFFSMIASAASLESTSFRSNRTSRQSTGSPRSSGSLLNSSNSASRAASSFSP